MMARGDLDERRVDLTPDALCFAHQEVADAPLADTRIDDQCEHPHDAIAVLEPGQHVERDEAQQFALVIRHEDHRVRRPKALESRVDVARPGRIALIGEQARDARRIGRARRAKDD